MLEQVWRAHRRPDADDKAETAGATRFDASRRILEHLDPHNCQKLQEIEVFALGEPMSRFLLRLIPRFSQAHIDPSGGEKALQPHNARLAIYIAAIIGLGIEGEERRRALRCSLGEELVKQLFPSTGVDGSRARDHPVQVEDEGAETSDIDDDHSGGYLPSSRSRRNTITGQIDSRITYCIVRARSCSRKPRQPRTMRSLSFRRAKSTIAEPASPLSL